MDRPTSGVTLRAVVIGIALCFLIGYGDTYGLLVIQGQSMTFNMSAPGAVFLFSVLVGVVNVVLRAIRRSLALDRAELITVFIMMLIASAIPDRGVMALLPELTSAFYYATPENDWACMIQPYIRDWMVPKGSYVVKYFYEGLPEGMDMPWRPWIKPLLIWFSFFIVLYVVMIAMMVIVRRQWMDHERLIYPIMQLPLEMIKEEDSGSIINPFFKNKLMWLGFSIPFVILSVNALHDYFSFFPEIDLTQRYLILDNSEELFIYIVFSLIGFTYFVNLDIAFSLWFFNLLFKMQKGYTEMLGWTTTEHLGPYSPGRSAISIHQDMGAMIVLVLYGLWVGRKHLRDVFRKAIGTAPEVDDSAEIMSYRGAVLCVIGGLAYIGFWLWLSGIPLWVLPIFLFGAFVLFVALSRIVAEAGIAWVDGPITAPAFVASGLGSANLHASALVPLSFTFAWTGQVKTSVMGFCANGLKLSVQIKKRRRALFGAMLLAATACFGGSVWAMLECGYGYGGINLGPKFSPFTLLGKVSFAEYAMPYIRNPAGPRWDGWLYSGIGGVGMGLLMYARHQFLWWPLHPIGFAISSVWAMHRIWFSIFIAWALKAIILKYGGSRLFAMLRPFFLGLILGEFASSGVWMIIDAITGMRYT